MCNEFEHSFGIYDHLKVCPATCERLYPFTTVLPIKIADTSKREKSIETPKFLNILSFINVERKFYLFKQQWS